MKEIMIYQRELEVLEHRLDRIDMENLNINLSSNPDMLKELLSISDRTNLLDIMMLA